MTLNLSPWGAGCSSPQSTPQADEALVATSLKFIISLVTWGECVDSSVCNVRRDLLIDDLVDYTVVRHVLRCMKFLVWCISCVLSFISVLSILLIMCAICIYLIDWLCCASDPVYLCESHLLLLLVMFIFRRLPCTETLFLSLWPFPPFTYPGVKWATPIRCGRIHARLSALLMLTSPVMKS